jgi:biotin carboxyl carrier protein
MKLKVQVEGQTFEVEVGDLSARPIVATVDGERFEVWPETETPAVASPTPSLPIPFGPTGGHAPAAQSPLPSGGDLVRVVRAPIPGVIVGIAVQPGANVGIGDELCVLEAMKMRNPIRATRPGQIAKVCVSVGQHVKHQDALLEYAD